MRRTTLSMVVMRLMVSSLLLAASVQLVRAQDDPLGDEETAGTVDLSEFDESSAAPGPVTEEDPADPQAVLLEFAEESSQAAPSTLDEEDNNPPSDLAEFGEQSTAAGPVTEEEDDLSQATPAENTVFLPFIADDTGDASLAATATTSEATGAATTAASHGIFADFNGDGFDDLAIGVPGEDIGNINSAGAVNVLYGSPGAGLTALGDDVWHQDVAGIGGVAEANDMFGAALAAGDFDNDGFDDLAIGVPGEDIGNINSAGAVNVLYGSATGLTEVGDQVWHQDVAGVGGGAEANDEFGAALTAGDFDSDGFDDLAIGVPGEDIGNTNSAGAVNVLYGSPGVGLTEAGDQVWHQDVSGIGGGAEANDTFGDALTAGDFNNDGEDDLAIGVPGEDIGNTNSAGAVNVIYGSPGSGLTALGDDVWHQDVAGIGGVAEANDMFGAALTAGDFDGDTFDDLAVGVPGEDIGNTNSAGAVNVLYGSASALTEVGDQVWHQDVAGVGGGAEANDEFGAALTAGDFDGDTFDDLAIGVPGEDIGNINSAGAVNVLYGSSGVGLTEAGDQVWHQDVAGVGGGAEANDTFGAALAASDFDGDGEDDLAIGVPGEDIGNINSAGAVNVLYGSSGVGLTEAGDQVWHQDVAGVGGAAEANDSFGDAVS